MPPPHKRGASGSSKTDSHSKKNKNHIVDKRQEIARHRGTEHALRYDVEFLCRWHPHATTVRGSNFRFIQLLDLFRTDTIEQTLIDAVLNGQDIYTHGEYDLIPEQIGSFQIIRIRVPKSRYVVLSPIPLSTVAKRIAYRGLVAFLMRSFDFSETLSKSLAFDLLHVKYGFEKKLIWFVAATLDDPMWEALEKRRSFDTEANVKWWRSIKSTGHFNIYKFSVRKLVIGSRIRELIIKAANRGSHHDGNTGSSNESRTCRRNRGSGSRNG